jgi:hypothetical protein
VRSSQISSWHSSTNISLPTVSECSWPMAFFDRFFPVLRHEIWSWTIWEFSNACMCLFLYSFAINLNQISGFQLKFSLITSTTSLSFLPSSLFALGCLNMLLGLIFRESAKPKRSITSWRAEAKGISAYHRGPAPRLRKRYLLSFQLCFSQEKGQQVHVSHETVTDAHSYRSTEKAGYGFGRQGEKVAGLRGFILQKPEESLPRYASPTPPRAATVSRSPSSVSSSSSFYADERPPSMPHSHPRRDARSYPCFLGPALPQFKCDTYHNQSEQISPKHPTP